MCVGDLAFEHGVLHSFAVVEAGFSYVSEAFSSGGGCSVIGTSPRYMVEIECVIPCMLRQCGVEGYAQQLRCWPSGHIV